VYCIVFVIHNINKYNNTFKCISLIKSKINKKKKNGKFHLNTNIKTIWVLVIITNEAKNNINDSNNNKNTQKQGHWPKKNDYRK